MDRYRQTFKEASYMPLYLLPEVSVTCGFSTERTMAIMSVFPTGVASFPGHCAEVSAVSNIVLMA
jgi:hypothetical protein